MKTVVRLSHLNTTSFVKRVGVITMCILLSACMAGKPKITSKDSQGGGSNNKITTSTKSSFASSSNIANAGASAGACASGCQVKFAIGYSIGKNGPGAVGPSVNAGLSYKILPTTMAVVREAY